MARPLAFSGNPGFRLFWGEAHNAPGATATGTKWAVADGETGAEPIGDADVLPDREHVGLCRGRPGDAAQRDGPAAVDAAFTVPANSRFTVPVAAPFPATTQDGSRTYGAVIESLPVGGQPPAQIVVERAMYSNANELFGPQVRICSRPGCDSRGDPMGVRIAALMWGLVVGILSSAGAQTANEP